MLVPCLRSLILLHFSEFCSFDLWGIGCLSINEFCGWKGYLRRNSFFLAALTPIWTLCLGGHDFLIWSVSLQAPFGPPFALIQGTLEAQGNPFRKAPKEACPTIKRGTVAWVGSGPEFFISLAKHEEWQREYTAFGSVLPEDMSIAERIAQLPTESEVWNNINVSVLEKPVPLALRRIKTSNGDVRGNSWIEMKSDMAETMVCFRRLPSSGVNKFLLTVWDCNQFWMSWLEK